MGVFGPLLDFVRDQRPDIIFHPSVLTGFFGWPEKVLSTEIWLDGRGVTTLLDYGGDLRAALSWVDVPALDSFRETFEIYGNHERVTLDFPSGFTKGLPTHLTVETTDEEGIVWKRSPRGRKIRSGPRWRTLANA